MEAKRLSSFSPGNPFHQDHISTGICLRDAVVIDERFNPEYLPLYIMFSGGLGEGLYIVNSETGERIQIFVPKKEEG